MTLEQLAIKYGSDKYSRHSYVEKFYSQLFAKKNIQKLLEIGIGTEDIMSPFVNKYVHGSSLYMWQEMFPHAEIYACDIRKDSLINEGRIHSMVCDQSSAESINKMISEWSEIMRKGLDLVIDDGSHRAQDQIFTFKELKDFVRPGGAYVIEDVNSPELVAKETGGTVYRYDKCHDDVLVVRYL